MAVVRGSPYPLSATAHQATRPDPEPVFGMKLPSPTTRVRIVKAAQRCQPVEPPRRTSPGVGACRRIVRRRSGVPPIRTIEAAAPPVAARRGVVPRAGSIRVIRRGPGDWVRIVPVTVRWLVVISGAPHGHAKSD